MWLSDQRPVGQKVPRFRLGEEEDPSEVPSNQRGEARHGQPRAEQELVDEVQKRLEEIAWFPAFLARRHVPTPTPTPTRRVCRFAQKQAAVGF